MLHVKENSVLILIKLISISSSIGVALVLVALLDKENYGFYGLIVSSLSIFFLLGNFGVNYTIIKKIPRKNELKDKWLIKKSAENLLNITFVLPSFIFALFLYYNLPSFSEQFIVLNLLVFVGMLYFHNRHHFNVAFLRAMHKQKSSLILENIPNNFLIVLIFLSIDELTEQVQVVLLISILVSFMLSYFFSEYKACEIYQNKKYEGISLKENIPFFNLALTQAIISNADTILVHFFYGAEATAEYFLAKKMIILISVYWLIYNQKYMPVLSMKFKNKELSDISDILRYRLYLLIPVVISLVLLNVSVYPVMAYFGLMNYSSVQGLIFIFSLLPVINVITGPVIGIMNITDTVEYAFVIVLFGIGALFLCFLIFLNASSLGLYGAAISVVISLITWKFIGVYLVYKKMGLNLLTGKISHLNNSLL